MKNIQNISTMVTAFFLVAVLSLAGCTARPSADSVPVSGDQDAEVADEVIDGFEMSLTDNGISKGLALADRAEKYGDLQLFRATSLTVLFYTESGHVQSVLTSRRGIIHTDTGDMEAMDSVVVFSSDSTRILQTEHLVWLKGDNRIQGDSAVVVTGPQGVVNGDGFTADVGFESIDLKNPTGDINVLGERF